MAVCIWLTPWFIPVGGANPAASAPKPKRSLEDLMGGGGGGTSSFGFGAPVVVVPGFGAPAAPATAAPAGGPISLSSRASCSCAGATALFPHGTSAEQWCIPGTARDAPSLVHRFIAACGAASPEARMSAVAHHARPISQAA